MNKSEVEKQVLYVTPVRHFGRNMFTPACELSHKFCELLEQNHFSEGEIKKIKELGYTFKMKEVEL